jgi:hypothetical protein
MRLALLVQKYLLYWYKSTTTDSLRLQDNLMQLFASFETDVAKLRYSLYLLYWYKSMNTELVQKYK